MTIDKRVPAILVDLRAMGSSKDRAGTHYDINVKDAIGVSIYGEKARARLKARAREP